MGLQELYFKWMSEKAFSNIRERRQYEQLLIALNSSVFYFSIPMDENRLRDGIDLRGRFGYENHYSTETIAYEFNNNSCSMLEMMVALILRGDERITYDYETGSKTDYIFKTMLESMQLIDMTNNNFNSNYVDYRIDRLLNHDYEPNGYGGLFTIDNPRRDMRLVDIWYQMNWFLQTIYERHSN